MVANIFYFTEQGHKIAERVSAVWENATIPDRRKITYEDFQTSDLIVFVGACGIAVRLIAPYVEDKLKDPAVLVVDERGTYVIPLLSGHVGGANEYACELAAALKAVPVITTATDINMVMAVDELAAANGLKIVNRDNIKKVSMGLLKGRPVNIALHDDVIIAPSDSELDQQVLGLIYQPIVVGLGMRRGIDSALLEQFFLTSLEQAGVSVDDVAGIASIDLKQDETALKSLCDSYNIPAYFYTAEELNQVTGDFEESEFVRNAVGVSDVSQRAAKALGGNGEFLLNKKKQNGMTISIFRKYRRITFEY